MKENQEDQTQNEVEELLSKEIIEKENKNIPKEINLNIYNYEEKKFENFKLLNEEEEMLLCKDEALNAVKSKKENKEEDIKIKELYNGEDNESFYCLNKKELRKKYFKIETDLNDDNENQDSLFDNQNEKEIRNYIKKFN